MSGPRTLFFRGEEDPGEHDEIWDDSALIEAYDRALASARAELGMDGGGDSKSSKPASKSVMKWRPGGFCTAEYEEDGESYEATIISADGRWALLEFIGYGNQQRTAIASLRSSGGKKARRRQQLRAELEAAAVAEDAEDDDESCGEGVAVESSGSAAAEERSGAEPRAAAGKGDRSAHFDNRAPERGCTDGVSTEVPASGQWGPPHTGFVPPPGPWGSQPGPWGPQPHQHGEIPAAGWWGAPPGPGGAPSGYFYPPHNPWVGGPAAPGAFAPPPWFQSAPRGPGGWNGPLLPPPPPPPPPPMRAQEAEGLANMLMSWYVSGFYTGFYQAQQEMEHPQR